MNAKTQAIVARLKAGEDVENREGGNSMVPLIYSRQPVTISPVDPTRLERGDIVYVKVHGRVYTHKVVGLRAGQVQITRPSPKSAGRADMHYKELAVRMERMRALLEGHTHARVTWQSSEDGDVTFHLHAKPFRACPVIGPYPADQMTGPWSDTAAQAVLAGALLRSIAQQQHSSTSGRR